MWLIPNVIPKCASLRAVSKILRQEKDARNIEENRKEKCGRKRKTTRRDEVF